MRSPAAILLSLLLYGCGQPAEMAVAPASRGAVAEEVAADAAAAPDVQNQASPPVLPPGPDQPSVPAGRPMLAYSYQYGIQAPPKAVRQLIARHEAACIAAGPARCQVTNSQLQEFGEDQVRGSLSIRAAPVWLRTFREGLASEARSEGGRLVRSNVTSEDLSRQIIDTEAALRAKTTLRDRLQNLLATRPGKLADLIELERELARVQGEIDATQSNLAAMRTRVATSDLTIEYASAGVLAPEGVLSPIGDALSDVVAIIAGTLAFMIRVVAVLFLWVLLIGGVLWIFRKRLPKLWPWRRPEEPPPAT